MWKFSFSCVVLCLASVSAHAEEQIGDAAKIEKDVRGALPGRTMQLKAGDAVFSDEALSTGAASRAQFVFADKTSLQMGPSSRVTLDRFVYAGGSGGTFNAAKGAFRFVSGPGHKGYAVKTPTATIGVRGTAFGVRATPAQTDAVLYAGVIEVCSIGGGACRSLDKPCTTVSVTAAGVTAPKTVGAKDWSFDKTCKGAPPPPRETPPPPAPPGGAPGDAPPPGFGLAPLPGFGSAPPSFSWSGLSIGVNAGSAVGDTLFADPVPLTGAAFLGGLKLGYNWQLTPNIVVGFETDAQYRSEIGGSTNSHGTISSSRGGYLGTARARLGYAFDRWLVYGTGGFAYGHILAPKSFSGGNMIAPAFTAGTSVNNPFLPGWTVGGGVQFAITNNISVGAEYLFVKLKHELPLYSTNIRPYPVGVCNVSEMHSFRASVNYGFSIGDAFANISGR